MDVLITDQTMPGVTGLELALAARKVYPDLPIVIMSGYLDRLPQHDELGVQTAPKPIRGAALVEIVTRAVQAQLAMRTSSNESSSGSGEAAA
jgi:DNA-binding NtrC family response regulator